MSISKFFETKYKIIERKHYWGSPWYEVHFRWWWCPFWFECHSIHDPFNVHGTVESAEEFARQKMSGEYGRKFKPRVISYLN